MHLRDQHRLRDFFFGDVEAFGDLEVRRLATELLEKRARPLADAVQRAGTIQWHPYDSRLLGQRLKNALPDPPHRVRDELDALRLVEFVRRADEPEVALVDQIGERDSLVLIFLGDGNDEAQVRPDELVERFLVFQADPLRERNFLFAGDERIDADVTKVLIERPFVIRASFGWPRPPYRMLLLLRHAVLCLTPTGMAMSATPIESSRQSASIERA